MKVLKNAYPLYARFNNAHHGFMKDLKNTNLLFMSVSKISLMIYEGHKNASPLYERFNNVQHGFMKALKMRISFFLCLSKICITIYEGRKKWISFVRALQ